MKRLLRSDSSALYLVLILLSDFLPLPHRQLRRRTSCKSLGTNWTRTFERENESSVPFATLSRLFGAATRSCAKTRQRSRNQVAPVTIIVTDNIILNYY